MKITNEEVIEALNKSGGFVTYAAKQLGVTYQAINWRIKHNQELQDIVEAHRQGYLDMGETKLLKALKDNQPWAICFFLKCQGKERGYIERTQLTGKDDKPLIPKIDVHISLKKVIQGLSRNDLITIQKLARKLITTPEQPGDS